MQRVTEKVPLNLIEVILAQGSIDQIGPRHRHSGFSHGRQKIRQADLL
jgi:hypothetical protein